MKDQPFVFASEDEAASYCEDWQCRLKLADWDVVVAIAPRRAFSDPGNTYVAGEVLPNYNKRVALIRLCAPADYPADAIIPQDHEATLVHELLHIYTGLILPGKPTEAHKTAEEQAINAIARALVEAKRAEAPEAAPRGEAA